MIARYTAARNCVAGVWGGEGGGRGWWWEGDRKYDDCRWTLKRNALTHELSSENADNVSLLTDPGSPSRLYLILPQHAFLVWGGKTPKHTDRQWPKAQTKTNTKQTNKQKKPQNDQKVAWNVPTLAQVITVLLNPSLDIFFKCFLFIYFFCAQRYICLRKDDSLQAPIMGFIKIIWRQDFRLPCMKITLNK